MILKGGVLCAVSARRITGYTFSDTIKLRGIHEQGTGFRVLFEICK
jgi:hypothetical protein